MLWKKNPATLIETKITWFLKSHFSLSFCFSRGVLLPESRFSAFLLHSISQKITNVFQCCEKNQATLLETKITWHFSGKETNCMWKKLTWRFFGRFGSFAVVCTLVLRIFVADSCCEDIATLSCNPLNYLKLCWPRNHLQLKTFAVTFFLETKALYEIGKRFPEEVTPLIFEFWEKWHKKK